MTPHRVCVAIAVLALLLALPAAAANVTNISSGGPVYATITGALAAAAAGDTLLVRSNVFNESPDITKNVRIVGGYDATFNSVIGVTIITNGGTAGSVIDVTGGAHLQLNNVRLQGGHVSMNGGGLDVRGGSTAIVNNCMIQLCRGLRGGGVYAFNPGTLVVLSNTPVRGNVANEYGGGIQAAAGARLIVRGMASLIMNNAAADGGGISLASNADAELANEARVYGNVAARRGGGVFVDSSRLLVQDGFTFIGTIGGANRVTNGSGGGVYAVNSEVTLRDGAALDANEASENGGGLYLSNSTLVASSAEIGIYFNGSTNSAWLGGAIYALQSRVVLSNRTFVVRGEALGGGGVYAEGGVVELDDVDIGFASVFGENIAVHGGGLLVFDATVRVVNTRIRGNLASSGVAGGVYVLGACDVTISNTLVQGNRGTQTGGLHVQVDGPVRIMDTLVVSNRAVAYGGALLQLYQSNTITRLQVRENSATDIGGAFVQFVTSGELVEAEVRGNVASNNVGGLFLHGAGYVRARDCQVINNTADANTNGTGFAGGLLAAGTVDWMAETQASRISGNRAREGGGIALIAADTLRLRAASAAAPMVIAENTAASGGGVALLGSNATVSTHGAVLIVSNTARLGGGVFVSNMAVFVARPTNGLAAELRANLASFMGGGAMVMGRTSVFDAVQITIAENCAQGFGYGVGGGGILAQADASVRLVNARVLNNVASNDGGGIFVTWGAVLAIDSDYASAPPSLLPASHIIGNHAGFQVGGIYALTAARALVKNALVVSNTAGNACGGFAALIAAGRLVNTILAHNRGGTLTDGVAFQSTTEAVLQHCSIVDNGAIGLWTMETTPVTVENTIIWGHTNKQILDTGVTSAVNFCAIEGGYPGLFNITNNPAFVNRAALHFQLDVSSPYIDKGATVLTVLNDCIGETRPYGLGWDIGAYEFVPEPGGVITALLAAGLLRAQRRRTITCSGG